MRHLAYAGMLVAVVAGSAWLEPALHVRVYARWRRLLRTITCVAPVFVIWDLYAVHERHWYFDRTQILGVFSPGRLPIEELAFFGVVPLASVMTLEAVRAALSWKVGDEPVEPAGAQRGSR